jgi:hypothetical protein
MAIPNCLRDVEGYGKERVNGVYSGADTNAGVTPEKAACLVLLRVSISSVAAGALFEALTHTHK